MSKFQTGVLFYLGLIVVTVVGFALVNWFGSQASVTPSVSTEAMIGRAETKSIPIMFHILLCLTIVIIVGNALGRVCERIGQPPVVGEVIAGILLGPSCLGLFFPELLELLVPPKTLDPGEKVSTSLKAISQLGVVLYMFLVGLELDGARLRNRAHSTIAISHASIAIPFLLGSILALWIYPRFAPEAVDFTSFALFCGISLSITAFPVLARILNDRKLQATNLGNVALGCAAADDVTAWCLLAFVVGVAEADLTRAGFVIIGAILFIGAMLLIVRPLIRNSQLMQGIGSHQTLNEKTLPLVFAGILACAWTTEVIGIHALFGAFLFGTIFPKTSPISQSFSSRVKDPVNMLLMPAFFAFTGMRTQLGSLTSYSDWVWCIVIIGIATLGKFGGSFIAARFAGETSRDAAALGVLMNTRGLMELIVLNIGLDLGIITPRLFTMMVIMALATTVFTGPALRFLLTPNHLRLADSNGLI